MRSLARCVNLLPVVDVAAKLEACAVPDRLRPPRAAPCVQDYVLTDTTRDFTTDADVAGLQDGAMLMAVAAGDRSLAQPARERISFQPHPKTMTAAGDYEYFAAQVSRPWDGCQQALDPAHAASAKAATAAVSQGVPPGRARLDRSVAAAAAAPSQGRHPFVYALSEFIDNSLRATRKNAPRPRSITVSLVVSGSNPRTARGLVCVADNGCGMSKQELNEWVSGAGQVEEASGSLAALGATSSNAAQA